MGPMSVMARGFSAPGVYPIAPGAVVSEQGRFDTAVRVTKEQLAVLQEKIEQCYSRHGRVIPTQYLRALVLIATVLPPKSKYFPGSRVHSCLNFHLPRA